MKRCSPPSVADQLVPGPQVQVVGVGEDDLRRRRLQFGSRVSALTVACVPTGMKTGVATLPRAFRNVPARAREWGSVASSW